MNSDPTPPVVIANRYEVVRGLGSGSFGEVWEVHDHTLGTRCALKLLSDQVFAGPWSESQILRGLSGEYVLPILNADVVQGRRYIVTEVMSGGTVEDRIMPKVGMDVSQAVRWSREACQGVARAHDIGLIHGDIKPGNLFLDARDEVLVGDFGLAQLVAGRGAAKAVGTYATMAPEVAAGIAGFSATQYTYTQLSDVYSLGATAYWMLAGHPPTPGPNVKDLVDVVRPDIWSVAPHVPRGLRDAINRSLSLDPTERQASASELAADLGLRQSPERSWNRVDPHEGHEQCFVGSKARSIIEVCVVSESESRLLITAHNSPSGRRLTKGTRSSSRRKLQQDLRSVFRACG